MSHVEVGSPEWCDAAERSEWGWMADVIREARGKVTPHPSYWGPAQRVAEARSIEGWRTKHPVPQEVVDTPPNRAHCAPIYAIFEDASPASSPVYKWRQGATAQHLRPIAERFFMRSRASSSEPAAKICMSFDNGTTWFDLPFDHYTHFRIAEPAVAARDVGRRPFDVNTEKAVSAVGDLMSLPHDRDQYAVEGLSTFFVVQFRSDNLSRDARDWRDLEGGDHVSRFATKITAMDSASLAGAIRKYGKHNARVVRRFVVNEPLT